MADNKKYADERILRELQKYFDPKYVTANLLERIKMVE